jgi:hypothetical protein
MRYVAIAVALCLALSVPAAAETTSHRLPEKDSVPTGTPTYEGRVGGEDIENAFPIPFLPFTDTGYTCGFLNDYDETCPYAGSLSPDVVYSYEPPYEMCISIDLCQSFYDTKVYVYEDEWTPANPHACNDDADCFSPPVPYTSELPIVVVLPGHTYYIVVDGYGGDCGEYSIEILDFPCGCCAPCPPDGVDEGEGPCYDGYVDAFNGGCNSDPPVFTEVSPSPETIALCGLGGNYDSNTMRDTDWYLLDLTCEETTITIDVLAEFSPILGFIDMSPGCGNITGFYSYVDGYPCGSAWLTETLPAGEWVVFVATLDWSGWPCDSEYVLEISGYDSCVPVEDRSWGTIKAIYR